MPADAGGDGHPLVIQLDRFAQAGQQLLGEPGQLLRLLEVGDQHQKLVAPQPGRHVVVVQQSANALGQQLEQLVPGPVAQGVVDQLEAVQIDKQQGELLPVEVGGLDLQLKPLLQQVAVAELGQGIVIGEVVELCLGLANGADVGEGDDIVGGVVAAVVDGADMLPGGEVAAILAQAHHLAMPGVAAGQQGVPGVVDVGVAARVHDGFR